MGAPRKIRFSTDKDWLAKSLLATFGGRVTSYEDGWHLEFDREQESKLLTALCQLATEGKEG